MSKKLTEWFPADVNPVHIGEYEYRYIVNYMFRAFWNGKKFIVHDKRWPDSWGLPISDPGKDGHWRGLAEKP